MSKKYIEELAMFDNSEVFHEFMKIAYDSGLSEMDEDSMKIGVNRDAKKEKELRSLYSDEATVDQDKNGDELIERAHKEKAEILNSYLTDAGEVKNPSKVHKIMKEVANKPAKLPNDVYHRNISAIKDLKNELVVIAKEMKVRDENELSSFASEIVQNIYRTKDLVKQAVPVKGSTAFLKTLAKAVAIGAGIAGIGYVTLGGFEVGNRVFSVEGACTAYINSLENYLNDNDEKLDQIAKSSARKQIENISKFKAEYKKLYYEFERSILSDNLKKAQELNDNIDYLIEPVLLYINEIDKELNDLQKEMRGKDIINEERTTTDVVVGNVKSLYSYVSTSSEAQVLRNLAGLRRSIQHDQSVRVNKIKQSPKLEMPETSKTLNTNDSTNTDE